MTRTALILLLCGCAPALPPTLPGTAGGGGADVLDGGDADAGLSSCQPAGDLMPGVWTPVRHRSINFYVTVASECRDGGFSVSDAGAVPYGGGTTLAEGSGIAPVACPGSTFGDCADAVFCSWDPNIRPQPPVYPGLFQVEGRNPARGSCEGVGYEAAATFTAPLAGLPATAGFILRRLAPATVPGQAELLVDIVPVADGVLDLTQPLARARYDTSQLPSRADNSGRFADVYATVAFEASLRTPLIAGKTYALYFHIDPPAIDHIGVAGAEPDENPDSTALVRLVSP